MPLNPLLFCSLSRGLPEAPPAGFFRLKEGGKATHSPHVARIDALSMNPDRVGGALKVGEGSRFGVCFMKNSS